jgi:hypothetical protein
MNRIQLVILVMLGFLAGGCKKSGQEQAAKTGTVRVTFEPRVKGSNLVLNGPYNTNGFGEDYRVSKFKFYINSVAINNIDKAASDNIKYHLIDASNASSLSFTYEGNLDRYDEIGFWIGVDSTSNVSGAQSGALDPSNDMFWTWSTGYVMAKIEGSSPVSTQVNNKIEYHIGGFSGPNNVLKKINIKMPSGKFVDLRQNASSEIIITADIDAWWQNPNNISFTANPVCTTPGTLAKQIADNYAKMFAIRNVINY